MEESNAIQVVASGEATSNAALVSFVFYLIAVFFLAWLSSRVRRKREFVGEYFLGSRNLGVWAFALTFAATNASGGSFMGFPALIYTHGWVLALWIASYMVVPLVTTGLLAKRLNHVARKAGAVTVPEILRERFSSAGVGILSTLLLTFFMFFYLLAQFKAGSSILATLLTDIGPYQNAVAWVAGWKDGVPLAANAEADYLLCLMVFAGAVIAYTAYGGFRAVVWTDVMQGLVMVVGVTVMLVLVLGQVGGLERATRDLAEMTPPDHGTAKLKVGEPAEQDLIIRKGAWLALDSEGRQETIRLGARASIGQGETESDPVEVIVITTEQERERIVLDELRVPIEVELTGRTPYPFGAGQKGVYVSAPGPSSKEELGFLSMGMALSFFVFWAISGAGQPSNMVRQMAFKSSAILKRSIVMVAVYYSLIYFPLVIVFCCGRLLLPGMEIEPDRTMPELARVLAAGAGAPWIAGLMVAAPFAADMSSVDSFLLMVSSGLVRDIYQRSINPKVSEERLKMLTYGVTALVGIAAVFAVLNPPEYLQILIVFASGGLAGCFLMTMGLTLFWPRMNAAGAVAGLLGGFGMHLTLYLVGFFSKGQFTAYLLFGIEPFIWDSVVSALLAITVALNTPPPDPETVTKYFLKSKP